MAFCFLLALYLFQSAFAQNKVTSCPYDQGLVDFCRIDAKLTFRLPINAEKVFLARIENSDVVDPIALRDHDLDQRRVVPKLDSGLQSTPGCKLGPDEANFVRFVDINDRNIRNQEWYVACAEYDAVDITYKRADGGSRDSAEEKRQWIELQSPSHRSEGNRSPEGQKCTRCTMIKELAQLDAPSSKFLQASWAKDRLESSILRYTSSDLPFESVKIFGRVIDLEARRQVFQFRQLIKSRQQMFIRLPRTDEDGRYAVVTDLYPQRNGTDLMVNDMPLALQDYIRLESADENVPEPGGKGGRQNRNWLNTVVNNKYGGRYGNFGK